MADITYEQTISASGSPLTIPSGGVGRGRTMILHMAWGPTNTSTSNTDPVGTVTITDSRGHSWRDCVSAGVIKRAAKAVVTTPLEAGDTITVSSSDGGDVLVGLVLVVYDNLDEYTASGYGYDSFNVVNGVFGDTGVLDAPVGTTLLHAQSRLMYDGALVADPVFSAPSGWTVRHDAVYLTTMAGMADARVHIAICTREVATGINYPYNPTYDGVRNRGWAEAGQSILPEYGGCVSWVRGLAGLPVSATCNVAGRLRMERWRQRNTGLTVAADLETSGVTSCALIGLPDGALEVYYCQSGDVKLRRSTAQGAVADAVASWSSAVTIASGYQAVAAVYDPWRKRRIAMLYKGAAREYYVTLGTRDAGGTLTWTTPVLVLAVDAGTGQGTLSIDPAGRVEFSYVNRGAGAAETRVCAHLQSDGTGTWVF